MDDCSQKIGAAADAGDTRLDMIGFSIRMICHSWKQNNSESLEYGNSRLFEIDKLSASWRLYFTGSLPWARD